jgi:hypothetical protein
MKIILSFLALLTIILPGCRKDDNPRIPDIIEVPLPYFEKDEATSLTISAQEPTTFSAKFSVDNFFENGTAPKEMDIVIMRNEDPSSVKTLLENVTTFPTTIEITGQQLLDLFGEPIVLGDRFDIGANITTQDNQVFPAFDAETGNAFGAGVGAMPGVAPVLRYEAVCAFTAADYAGDFEVITDEWADYAAGTVIPVTVIDENHISFEYLTDDPIPIIVEVNLATNETTVVKQVYGDYSAFGISGMTVETAAPATDNFVAPCEGILSLRLAHEDDAGGFYGNNLIVLKKVQ